MKRVINLLSPFTILIAIFAIVFSAQSCKEVTKEVNETVIKPEVPEYFLLRPELEKMYGYSHAVKIGDDLKISGAVSMDNDGNVIGEDDMALQMKNCYNDLEKVLKHYGYSFDDVIVENVFTTDMTEFLKAAGYRNEIYKTHFPTGSWLEVKGLAIPGLMIEIEMEAHKSN